MAKKHLGWLAIGAAVLALASTEGAQATTGINGISPPGSIVVPDGLFAFTDYGGSYNATVGALAFGSTAPITFSLHYTNSFDTQADGSAPSSQDDRLILIVTNNSGKAWSGFDISVPSANLLAGDAHTPGLDLAPNLSSYGDSSNYHYQFGSNPLVTIFDSGYAYSFDPLASGGSFSIYLPLVDLLSNSDGGSIQLVATPQAIPEPLTLSLVGAGLVGAAAIRRRRKPV